MSVSATQISAKPSKSVWPVMELSSEPFEEIKPSEWICLSHFMSWIRMLIMPCAYETISAKSGLSMIKKRLVTIRMLNSKK